jgi:hypothetical protein
MFPGVAEAVAWMPLMRRFHPWRRLHPLAVHQPVLIHLPLQAAADVSQRLPCPAHGCAHKAGDAVGPRTQLQHIVVAGIHCRQALQAKKQGDRWGRQAIGEQTRGQQTDLRTEQEQQRHGGLCIVRTSWQFRRQAGRQATAHAHLLVKVEAHHHSPADL